MTALECDAVALVLETLRSNQALDARSLGVRLLALGLWLDLTADNKLADLIRWLDISNLDCGKGQMPPQTRSKKGPARNEGEHSHHPPC